MWSSKLTLLIISIVFVIISNYPSNSYCKEFALFEQQADDQTREKTRNHFVKNENERINKEREEIEAYQKKTAIKGNVNIDCSEVSNGDLRSYCRSGRCSDLLDDYDLYSFCSDDDKYATRKLAKRRGMIYDSFEKYYETGDTTFFTNQYVGGYHYLPNIAAKYAGSKQSRKEFIIYLWKGTVLH
jgi:hypothetical protein